METLLAGISAERLATSRLATGVLSVAGRTGPAERFLAELCGQLAGS